VDRVLDERMMALALEDARDAAEAGDVPVGAVVAMGERVLGRAGNAREREQDPTAHAEILALRDAAAAVGSWRLTGCVLVVTLEPCPMCAGAAVAARLDAVAFGASDPKAGALGSLYNLGVDPRLNHELQVIDGIEADAAAAMLSEFFEARRDQTRTA
jgi:tRNA(adenine34) deaminase